MYEVIGTNTLCLLKTTEAKGTSCHSIVPSIMHHTQAQPYLNLKRLFHSPSSSSSHLIYPLSQRAQNGQPPVSREHTTASSLSFPSPVCSSSMIFLLVSPFGWSPLLNRTLNTGLILWGPITRPLLLSRRAVHRDVFSMVWWPFTSRLSGSRFRVLLRKWSG